jgi:hypothetical protein
MRPERILLLVIAVLGILKPASLSGSRSSSRTINYARAAPLPLSKVCRLRGGGRGSEQYSFSNLADVPTAEYFAGANDGADDEDDDGNQDLEAYMAARNPKSAKNVPMSKEQHQKIEEMRQ